MLSLSLRLGETVILRRWPTPEVLRRGVRVEISPLSNTNDLPPQANWVYGAPQGMLVAYDTGVFLQKSDQALPPSTPEEEALYRLYPLLDDNTSISISPKTARRLRLNAGWRKEVFALPNLRAYKQNGMIAALMTTPQERPLPVPMAMMALVQGP